MKSATKASIPKHANQASESSNPKTAKLQPTAAEALALINSLRGEAVKYGHTDSWITHSILVGDCAGKIAAAIRQAQLANQPSKNQLANGERNKNSTAEYQTNLLDPDRATALGYLHDIGKGLGPRIDHPLTGYHYLKSHGYADEFCSVCLTHSFTAHECEMTSGYRPDDVFLQNYIATHENTLYEDITILCDLYCHDRILPLEGRLVDVIIRYGASDRTAHRLKEIYKLKFKIEQLLAPQTIESVLGLPAYQPLLHPLDRD